MNRSTPEDELRREVDQLRAENARLRALLGQAPDKAPATPRPAVSGEPLARTTLFEEDLASLPRLNAQSPGNEKISLYRALFAPLAREEGIRCAVVDCHQYAGPRRSKR